MRRWRRTRSRRPPAHAVTWMSDLIVARPSPVRHHRHQPDHAVRLRTSVRAWSTLAGMTTPNPEKDPKDWVTGDEPATGPQRSYLSTLAREAGEDVPDDVSKAQAS